ncbi:hypothetical protein F4821DRAFT_247986 [Hypoxylon rubiginosum]|uniref:Uncharacterized protein n=1 Tax=Hypoxylon rubiginosum TaxID=110542 RepID=A0ACC0CP44_9PEZI|nr:hypothetical protein F4821DRAFT_247986 [Hypoxylon rubiginosum]
MPAATEGPTVSLSFANNFWGKDDAGVGPLLDRMASAKQTSDELRSFYSARCSIEEEYARKLLSLSRKALGTHEMGSLRGSLDTVRGEVESMGKQHANIASQMKSELEEPLAAFAGGMKERRKIVQNTVEKLLKVKIQQTNMVNKTRDRYEQDCLKIKGYLAQGHMVMGQEERKNKARLEKTQISLATTNTEYENAIKALEETTVRWNREWKAAADKFQDLEEERLDFTKGSLWTFANIASTVCVSDDASCEKIRLSLEKMDVEKDILNFINERGTGQEIPDPPKYINFCRGDVEDHASEASDDENYSVAQFPRSINPAFRTSSPQPSTFESHHDPNSALARDLAHEPHAPSVKEPDMMTQKAIMPLQNRRQANAVEQQLQFPRSINPGFRAPSPQPSTYESHHDPNSSLARELQRREPDPPAVSREAQRQNAIPPISRELQHREPNASIPRDIQRYEPTPPLSREPRYEVDQSLMRDFQRNDPNPLIPRDLQRDPNPPVIRDLVRNEPPISARREPVVPMEKAPSSVVASRELTTRGRRQESNGTQQQYDSSQFSAVPHDPYPMDGMTMLCRTDGMNSATSSNLSARPSSRDDNSEYSNPTSFSSQEPPSGKVSPVKQEPAPVTPVAQPEKRMLKKKSGFFQNHSPFRRKSMKEVQPPAQTSNRNTWAPTTSQAAPSPRRPQAFQPPEPQSLVPDRIEKTASPEPIEANASLALNIGQNVFPVANTDKRNKPADNAEPPQDEDPIALALAELKGVAGNKAAADRISADHYHGIATPRPDRAAAPDRSPAMSRSVPAPRGSSDLAAGLRGTPPPSYDQQVQRLGVPPPAVTSKAMKESSRKYVEQTRDMFNQKRPNSTAYSGGQSFSSSTPSRPTTRGNDMSRNMPRATSPAPPRSASPQPSIHPDTRSSHRSVSPNPYSSSQQQHRSSTQSQAAASPKTYTTPVASPSSYGGSQMRNSPGAASPSSYGNAQARNSPQASRSVKRGSDQGYQRHNSSTSSVRGVSPSPYRGDYSRPASRASEMAMQLAPVGGDGSVYGGSVRGRGNNGRPDTSHSSRAMTFYDGRDPMAESKPRSQSVADPSRQYTPDGRAILHYARALYMYQAAIPEELGFAKGDTLAVLRHQDDGWWEAEIHAGQGVGRSGLVPSNYLQPC